MRQRTATMTADPSTSPSATCEARYSELVCRRHGVSSRRSTFTDMMGCGRGQTHCNSRRSARKLLLMFNWTHLMNILQRTRQTRKQMLFNISDDFYGTSFSLHVHKIRPRRLGIREAAGLSCSDSTEVRVFWRAKGITKQPTSRQLWRPSTFLRTAGSGSLSISRHPSDDAKVAGVRASVTHRSLQLQHRAAAYSLGDFRPLTTDDVIAAVRQLPDKHCSSDPRRLMGNDTICFS